MRHVRITHLYSFGMLLSGVSMAVMMSLETLALGGIIVAGLIMGLSYGFFWANRDFLALSSTDDGNRNYYYGLESFFNTVASVVVPGMIGAFLGATADHGWFAGNINFAYKLVTVFVFALTIVASAVVCRGRFCQPGQGAVRLLPLRQVVEQDDAAGRAEGHRAGLHRHGAPRCS